MLEKIVTHGSAVSHPTPGRCLNFYTFGMFLSNWKWRCIFEGFMSHIGSLNVGFVAIEIYNLFG